jgi:uncharacterized protein YjbJ (UPF0337 family)
LEIDHFASAPTFGRALEPSPVRIHQQIAKGVFAMVNQQTLQGNWNEIKGKLKSKWGQLTNDDLQQAHGSVDQLIGLIQRKTGEAEELTSNGSSGFTKATEAVKEYAHTAMESMQDTSKRATETVRKGYDQASESLQQGYEEAEHMIKKRPAESAAVCFGIGMVVGVLLGLTMRSR